MKFTTAKKVLTSTRVGVLRDRGPVIIAGTKNFKIYAPVASKLGITAGDSVLYVQSPTDENPKPQLWLAKCSEETEGSYKISAAKKTDQYLICSGADMLRAARSSYFAGKNLAANERAIYQLGTETVSDEGMTFTNLVFVGVETFTPRTNTKKGETAAASSAPAKASNVFEAPDSEATAEAVTDELDLDEEEEDDDQEGDDL